MVFFIISEVKQRDFRSLSPFGGNSQYEANTNDLAMNHPHIYSGQDINKNMKKVQINRRGSRRIEQNSTMVL